MIIYFEDSSAKIIKRIYDDEEARKKKFEDNWINFFFKKFALEMDHKVK